MVDLFLGGTVRDCRVMIQIQNSHPEPAPIEIAAQCNQRVRREAKSHVRVGTLEIRDSNQKNVHRTCFHSLCTGAETPKALLPCFGRSFVRRLQPRAGRNRVAPIVRRPTKGLGRKCHVFALLEAAFPAVVAEETPAAALNTERFARHRQTGQFRSTDRTGEPTRPASLIRKLSIRPEVGHAGAAGWRNHAASHRRSQLVAHIPQDRTPVAWLGLSE